MNTQTFPYLEGGVANKISTSNSTSEILAIWGVFIWEWEDVMDYT